MSDVMNNKSFPPSSERTLPIYMRRKHARLYKKAPITFALLKTTETRNATMYNESIGGMYFETDVRLMPGTIIRIQLITPISPLLPTETNLSDSFYTAEVRWCREIKKNLPHKRFGVGVHYHKALLQ